MTAPKHHFRSAPGNGHGQTGAVGPFSAAKSRRALGEQWIYGQSSAARNGLVLILPHSLKTDRLLLRPTRAADADRAFEIQADWEVTRMLSMASFPPARQEIARWFADHEREWLTGKAYRFAVDLDGRMIGMVDIDGIVEREGTLGYWFDRAAWGRGYAFEAAHVVTHFAFEDVGLMQLKAGHADDNPASGRLLIKLGFTLLDTVQHFSRPRGENIARRRYKLTRQD